MELHIQRTFTLIKTELSAIRNSILPATENPIWLFFARQTVSGMFSLPTRFTGNISGELATDIIAPADYNGDGRADIAVFRPSDGDMVYQIMFPAVPQFIRFGANGDIPVPADYDGDGFDDIAVYSPSNGVWYIRRSSDSQIVTNAIRSGGRRSDARRF